MDAKFLQFPNDYIRVAVAGTRVNRGAKFGLEFLRNFYEDSRVTTWVKKAVEKVYNSVNVKGEKVVKYKHLKIE